MRRKKTTRGLTEEQLLGPAAHCAARLMERYGVASRDEAEGLYLRHHVMLNNGRAPILYSSPIGGRVYRLEDEDGRVYYPVRRKSDENPRVRITVTYLSPDMVYETMMGEGPAWFRPI